MRLVTGAYYATYLGSIKASIALVKEVDTFYAPPIKIVRRRVIVAQVELQL